MKGLHIQGLSHSYGDNKVLDNAGLIVPAGELVKFILYVILYKIKFTK